MTTTATSPTPAEDILACAMEQLEALDYDGESFDKRDHRLVARHVRSDDKRSGTNFRRVFDRVTVEADSAAATSSSVRVTAQTFAEFFTQRGPTFDEEKASIEAQDVAATLLTRCATSQ